MCSSLVVNSLILKVKVFAIFALEKAVLPSQLRVCNSGKSLILATKKTVGEGNPGNL